MLKFYGLKNCSTCKRVEKFFAGHDISIDYIDIRNNPPSREELEKAFELYGSYTKMMNTSGQAYRHLGLKDKLIKMSHEEIMDFLNTNGMLIKRPFVIGDGKMTVGSRLEELEGTWLEMEF